MMKTMQRKMTPKIIRRRLILGKDPVESIIPSFLFLNMMTVASEDITIFGLEMNLKAMFASSLLQVNNSLDDNKRIDRNRCCCRRKRRLTDSFHHLLMMHYFSCGPQEKQASSSLRHSLVFKDVLVLRNCWEG